MQRNAVQHVPKVSMRSSVAADLRDVFNAPTRNEADRRLAAVAAKHRADAPQLADWMESNIPEGLTVFRAPPAHRVQHASSAQQPGQPDAERIRRAHCKCASPYGLRALAAPGESRVNPLIATGPESGGRSNGGRKVRRSSSVMKRVLDTSWLGAHTTEGLPKET